MLLLNPKEKAVWVTHDATGARFKIKVMDSTEIDALEAQATEKDGVTVDFPRLAERFAVECIEDWEKVGDQGAAVPCSEANRIQLARAHHNTIVAWLMRQARSLDNFKHEELEAAKKD